MAARHLAGLGGRQDVVGRLADFMGEQGPGTQGGKWSNLSHNALTIIGRAAKGKRQQARDGNIGL
jgi:hypothetical protein